MTSDNRAGATLFLDGFLYALQGTTVAYDREADEKYLERFYVRPPVKDPALQERMRRSPNHKLGGKCRDSDLVEMTPAQLVQAIEDQAAAIERGNARRRVFARAAADRQKAMIPKVLSGPVFVLPGRFLIKPPAIARRVFENGKTEVRDIDYCPVTPKEAGEVVEALLSYSLPFDEDQPNG